MYLKSLVLKGFKSFADRSVLTLEPGITAIVGPNGSGKSNISDAVLWVLGERSARNLRGQAMEDIIFAGSAARKAVSIAEVELVLDNSDGTLPVEFDEVSVARRMYRSGESEYLVNGVVSRRLDVLDILHDSGLGTGTHSIISQGSLDSILQSRPEDRRALIEEAAGVLKHKQRKEKSARKLEAMDNHLARVRDVAAEVSRQLGPLERKAKRAEAYEKASKELAELRLAVAVDDLRALQGQWDQVCAAEAELGSQVEQRRAEVATAEQKVNDYQELMRQESQDAGELARRQRRAANVAERLDSAEMLVRERRRAAVGYEADMLASLDGSTARREAAARELAQAREQLAEAQEALGRAVARVDELDEERRKARAACRDIEERGADVAAQDRACERETTEAQKKLAVLKESLSSGLAHVTLVEARKQELATELERCREAHEKAKAAAANARETLAQVEREEAQAQEHLLACFAEREEARAAQDAARERKQMLDSEAKAIEQSLRTTREGDPALAWVIDNAERFGAGLQSVARTLKVKGPSAHEELVEALLGEDLSALSVADGEQARQVAQAIAEGDLTGGVSLVMGAARNAEKIEAARGDKHGDALIDAVTCPNDMRSAIEALLGDVVLCSTREQALAAHAADRHGLRFASSDGCVVWPNGKVRVFGKPDEQSQGVLARERRLDEARAGLRACEDELAQVAQRVEAADEAHRGAQAASLKLSQQLANHKGTCAAAEADEERALKRLTSVTQEIADVEARAVAASKSVEELRPEVEAAEGRIAELEERRRALLAQRDELEQELQPATATLRRIGGELSEAKLNRATLTERKTYADRMVTARERDVQAIDDDALEARRTLFLKRAAAARGEEVLAVFAAIAHSVKERMRVIDEAVSASESSTSSVHAQAATARDAARAAHDAYDEASARVAQVRVDKSRLEVQVETAVNRVVVECGTPLEQAEQLPVLEDRAHVEDEVFRLERRIRNMGTINPDAAQEYALLKQRFDFLDGQLSDMEAARRSLARIVRVIDARMKDDFVQTFEQVNENFNEIFALLFPGGSAHLSLEDPDDVEHSGVEVTAQPRGKRLTKMMLMSGGEKSLTALALLFAVYKTRATPFYILDEVEAALDDTNLRRLTSYIDTLRASTQLIMITHQRRTMEMADVLFGVSMQADGVTKVISQKLERALESAE